MTIMRSGELLRVTTPRVRTSGGRRGRATETRFWTRTLAWSRLVPSLNVMVSAILPSLVEYDDMYSMFSTPLISCSMGLATVSATVSAFAPGYDARTTIVGGAISGYCATGRLMYEMYPTRTVTI